MQKYILNTFMFFIILSMNTIAQNTLRIQSPARITTSGAVQVVYGGGNFTNNGTYTDAAGTFRAVGGTTFSGTGTTGFYNATFNHPSANTVFGSQVSVNNQTTLTAGNLDAGALKLYLRSDLNPNANLINNGVLTGTVNGLVTKATVTSGATAYSSTLSLNISGTAQQYQWQSSTDNINWSNVASATSATYNASVNSNTYYRCVLTTNNSAFSQSSPSVLLVFTAPTGNPFITRWDLSKSFQGAVGANEFSFGVATTGPVNYTWQQVGGSNLSGSGTFTGIGANITGLPANAIIDLSIDPNNFQRINLNNGAHRMRLTEVKQWGDVVWICMETAFNGCNNFTLTATDVPNFAGVTNMSQMFSGCSSFNQALPEGIITTNVTNMSAMFKGCKIYNQSLPSSFNTAAVTDMSFMFYDCNAYNKALPSGFNTANVVNMESMFLQCGAYNQALSNSFVTAAVTNMSEMFFRCSAYNQPLPSSFTTAAVTNMRGMFTDATSFNQPIGNWSTTNVTNMYSMFNGATSFNQPIGNWNTTNVTNMREMFSGATSFNQPVGNWNTNNVTSMIGMFYGAASFDQDLSGLELGSVTELNQMLSDLIEKGSPVQANIGMSSANYDATLIGWASQTVQAGVTLGANGRKYCASTAARNTLTTTKGWTITGDASACTTTTLVSNLNPSTSGNPITLTATVSPNTATGTVTFKDGTNTLGTVTLINGVASISVNLSIATHAITAVYNGNATNTTSTSAVLNQVVVNCALTASPGNVNITWTGSQGTDWNNACNWNPAWVPDVSNAKVIILSTTNKPVIFGTVPDVNSIDVNAGAFLTINSGGILNIRENGGINKGIRIDGGTLINGGTINIESATNTAINAYIYLSSTNSNLDSRFFNSGTVKINSTDEAIGVGISSTSTAYINNSGIINIVNGIGVEVALPTDIMNFTNQGTINYNGTTLALSLQGNSIFTNEGIININSGTGISKTSSVSLVNNNCGIIMMATGSYENGGGTTTNSGLFQMPNNLDYTNTGTFTNNGVLKANSVTGVTNNSIIISNTCPIFTIGGNPTYTINDIFTNTTATNSAGTYTLAGNIFVANNTLPTGLQTLYAKLGGGPCDDETVIIPFDFNNAKPTAVSISSTTVCEGASVNLLATCASGTPTWYATATGGTALGTGASFSYSPSVGGSQSFYAACETTNCKSGRTTTSNTVTVNPNPTANANSNSPVCEGTTINLSSVNPDKISINSGGPPPQTYAWTGVNSFSSNLQNPIIPSVTMLASGTYQVTVTSFEGCTASATTSVTVIPSPVLNPSSNSPVCSGETLFLTAKGNPYPNDNDTYVWAGVNGFTANTQNPNLGNVSMSANGVYTVTATNSANCSATATVLVTVKQTPTLVVSNFTNPTPENNPDGTISFTTNLPNGIFSLSYGSTGSPKNVTVASGAFVLGGLVSGVYGNFAVTNDGCTGRNNTEVTLLSTPFTLVKSIATGNWESSTTWNVGRVPKTGDVVIVDAAHTVTINGNGTAKDVEVRGVLKYATVGIIINLGL